MGKVKTSGTFLIHKNEHGHTHTGCIQKKDKDKYLKLKILTVHQPH